MDRYNTLYEQFDQDTQHAVETVLDLESKLNDLKGCDKYAIQLEDKIKSLKGTIKDYKFEIASYRLLLNNNK